jgi:hypothetical protein
MYRRFWLWMPHIRLRLAEDDPILAIVEEGTEFGFSGRGDYEFQCDGIRVKCSIEGDRLTLYGDTTHEEMAACPTPGIAL